MDGLTQRSKRFAASRRIWYGCLAATASLFGSSPAHAGPIHRDHETRAERIAGRAARRVPKLVGVFDGRPECLVDDRSSASDALSRIGNLEGDPDRSRRNKPLGPVHALEAKRRSDQVCSFSPQGRGVLDKLSAAPTTAVQVLTSPPSTPSNDTPSPPTQAQSITQIPEPGPWLLALSMAGWGLWRFRLRR